MKLKKCNNVWQKSPAWKCIVACLLSCWLGIQTFPSYSQEKIPSVSLDIKNESLIQVIENLRKQTNYNFMFNADEVQGIAGISLQVVNVPLTEVLNKLLSGTPDLTYTIDGKTVVIKKQIVKDVKRCLVMGTVYDQQKQPIPGVTVKLSGMMIGTVTDVDGCFVMTLPSEEGMLEFSFVGYKTAKTTYSSANASNLVIYLEEDVITMDEVTVVSTGLQSVNRRDMVGSFSQVKAEDIKIPGKVNIVDMLQGQIPGMVVTRTSARAGSSAKIKIRGTSTLGNTDPLFVVDGIIQEDPIRMNAAQGQIDDIENMIGDQVSWLNPDDIETITVLKDASATAIYGSRASNGVIVITTKKPKRGDRISVRYTGSFSFTPRLHYDQFNLMNSRERVQFADEAFAAGALYQTEPIADMNTPEGIMRLFFQGKLSEEDYFNRRDYLATLNTDWLKLLTRQAVTHTHNVSIGGGAERVSYSASLGYSKQEGQEKGNDTERFTANTSLNMRLHEKLQVALGLNGTLGKTLGYANGVNPLQYATTTSRAIPAFEEDGTYAYYLRTNTYGYNGESKYLSYNILNEMENSRSTVKNGRIGVTLNLNWDLTPWLKYQLTGGYSYNSVNTNSYSSERSFYVADEYRGYDYGAVTSSEDPWYNAALLPHGGVLFATTALQQSYNIQNKLLISKNFDENNRLNVMLGTEVRSSYNHTEQTTYFGYVPERGYQFISPTKPEDFSPVATNNTFSGFGVLNTLFGGSGAAAIAERTENFFSLFATVSYSFMNRYVFNANVRNDASNRFGQNVNRRFDPTYSFGLSWRVSEEPWMAALHEVITDLNFKATYGIQGNANLNTSPDLILKLGGIKYPNNVYYSSISSIPNPNLSWERTHTWNFGMDFQLFNRFNIVLDYYTRRSNAVVTQPIDFENGVNEMNINGGILYNNGVELTVSFNPVNTEDFGINLSVNTSKNWNKGGETPFDPTYSNFLNGYSEGILKEGYPLSSIWSWEFAGLNPENGNPQFGKMDADPETVKSDPTAMLVYSGATEPDFTGGVNFGVRYKNLTLNTSFSLLLGGVKRLNSPYSKFSDGFKLPGMEVNVNRDLLNRWKKPGDELYTTIPSLQNMLYTQKIPLGNEIGVMGMYAMSSELIVKSSFLRCQNLGVSWRMPAEMAKKIGFSNFTASASVSNLFVVASKRFNGFDPELQDSVMPRNYSLSVSVGF